MCCPPAFIASATMDCSPTPTAKPTSPPRASFCISRPLSLPPIPLPSTPEPALFGPPSCADTAVRRCSSSRPSPVRSTSADRRLHRVHHEHPSLTPSICPVDASSNGADTKAYCHRRVSPRFLHAPSTIVRISPPGHFTPQRRVRRIDRRDRHNSPHPSVQIPIAYRRC